MWLLAGSGLAAAEEGAETDYSGVYEMQGVIRVVGSSAERPMSGKIVLKQDGQSYRSTFYLKTIVRTDQGKRDAELIGNGEGKLVDGKLTGSAETQMVTSKLGGAMGSFPGIPKEVSSVSSANVAGHFEADGALILEFENEQLAGFPERTRTEMKGVRIDD
jgi:hypothetical protein